MSIPVSLMKREDKASDHLGVIIGTSPFSLSLSSKLINRIMCWGSCYYCSYRTHNRFRQEEESEKVLNGNEESVITNKRTFPAFSS